eukprot:gnl/MRDRNA2_/MRDRNA2_29473_c0_seq1.p1 gnl/MRDRNA2_/MRDRNA2_29473_c0~~gnl/MRDRNA2_/MRDRNA2_29473_c0_seq1.p1  ORF type:complete len:380 (+),score=74.50 gnl/MRDRNA2_/MRDRNA2_29473_c0_seq1:142-1281(+)
MFQRWKAADRRGRPSLEVEIPGRRGSGVGLETPGHRVSKRRIRTLRQGQKIYDLYYWEEVLQEDGAGGKVVVCRKKNDEDQDFKYVLKIRSKESVALQDQQTGTCFHQTLTRIFNLPPHLGVTPIIEILENDEYYYIVMEKAAGGSLVDNLLNRHKDGVMPEGELKQMISDMLEAVGHVHKQGIIHRDIKPDNFVVRRVASSEELKEEGKEPSSPKNLQKKVERVSLIDFDHADADYSPCSPGASPKTDCIWGTQGFNAPETYLGHSLPASDLWSLGVILYLFMTGSMPYDVKKLEKDARKEHRNFSVVTEGKNTYWFTTVYDKMLATPPNWLCEPWASNKACTDFCQKLLSFHHESRPQSAEEALRHPWLVKDECRGA